MGNFTRLEFKTEDDAKLYIEMRSCPPPPYRRPRNCGVHTECDDLLLHVGHVLVERDGKWHLTF